MSNRIFVCMQEGMDAPEWLPKVEDFMTKVMKELGYDGEEVSIMFCGDEYIRKLNKSYRNIDSATDVLSFENDEVYEDEEGKWKCVGDIAISLETLPVNAEYFDETKNNELKRLLVHGLLHLNGMDHGEEHIEGGAERKPESAPECEMLKLQEKILEKLKDEKIII